MRCHSHSIELQNIDEAIPFGGGHVKRVFFARRQRERERFIQPPLDEIHSVISRKPPRHTPIPKLIVARLLVLVFRASEKKRKIKKNIRVKHVIQSERNPLASVAWCSALLGTDVRTKPQRSLNEAYPDRGRVSISRCASQSGDLLLLFRLLCIWTSTYSIKSHNELIRTMDAGPNQV